MNLIFRNLRQTPSKGHSDEPCIPPGQRVYAIGDVHGRLDLLEELLGSIEKDNDRRARAKTTIVMLGDLIDRGPSSAQVIERVRTYCLAGARVICLCGNHEEVLIRILRGDGDLIDEWMKFGGSECLRSYGLSPSRLKRMAPSEAVRRVRTAIPKTHVKFLLSLADTVRIGDYLFVHAGIRPGVDLMSQVQADMRWIRDPFLSHEESHEFVVVHGHTISSQVEELSNRIGIDTGAYRSGVLTAVGLEGPHKWFLEARNEAADADQPSGVVRKKFA